MTDRKRIEIIYNSFFKKYTIQLICILFLLIFSTSIAFLDNLLNKYLIDEIIIAKKFEFFFIFILLFIGLNLFCIILSFIIGRWNLTLTQNCSISIRKHLLNCIQKSRMIDILKLNLSNYMVLMMDDIAVVSNFFSNVIIANIVSIFSVILMFIFVLYYSKIIAYLILFFSILQVITSVLFSNKIKKNQNDIKTVTSEHIKKIDINYRNLPFIKSFLLYSKVMQDYISTLNKIKGVAYNNFNIEFSLNSILKIIVLIRNVIIISIGCYSIKNGTLTLGVFVILINLSESIRTTFSQIVLANVQIQSFKVSVNRLFNVLELDKELEIIDSKRLVSINDERIRKIKFIDVDFSYNKTDNNILNNFNVNLTVDKVNIIIGKSGQGKSTLANILLGLFKIDSGDVLFNEKSISDLNVNELRSNISICFQDDYFWGDTIYQNFDLIDEKVSNDKINYILDIVEAKKFINNLPDGIHTKIGEVMNNLSGGELKRISLAMTLLKEAQIYIFDESFTNVDYVMRNKIFRNITNYLNGKIVIVITHDENLYEGLDVNLIDVVKNSGEAYV